MRRRKPKIKVILITFLFLLLCSTAYAYLETSLSIKGSVMGNYNNDGYVIDPGSNPYLEINNLTLGRSKTVLERGFMPLKTIIEAYASNGHTEFS